ncbi:hypothetical protein [Rhizobium leguminosarum]|uniref:hypothetical protein n=1 Tax=Rhizobium leguminosarum TaxID=384 RepID=UPI001C94C130|nr:hypothetical protein [Rhizobium leguminosarum]MBY5827845.1 hypothetical protein [Rhizobium leguminosarum]
MKINIGICKEQLRTSIRAAAIDTHSQTWRLKIFADEAYFHLSNVDERSARRVIGSNEIRAALACSPFRLAGKSVQAGSPIWPR